jgi:hypothetical protein
MPGARRTRSPCAKGSKHTVVTTVAPEHPAFPHAMVLTVSFVLSPVTGLFVTVANGAASANLTPAPGRQDHTTSPSTICAIRQKRLRVHRIPRPTSVTIAKRPSHEARDGEG